MRRRNGDRGTQTPGGDIGQLREPGRCGSLLAAGIWAVGARRPSSRGEIPCRTVNKNSSAEGWAGGGVEGALLGAKLGLAFINICMNDLAETISSTLMRSPARQAGSEGQILSSAAAAPGAPDAGWPSCDASIPRADSSSGTTALDMLMPHGHTAGCSPEG